MFWFRIAGVFVFGFMGRLGRRVGTLTVGGLDCITVSVMLSFATVVFSASTFDETIQVPCFVIVCNVERNVNYMNTS